MNRVVQSLAMAMLFLFFTISVSAEPFTKETLENQTATVIDAITGNERFNISAHLVESTGQVRIELEVYDQPEEFYVHKTAYYSIHGELQPITLESTTNQEGEWGENWIKGPARKVVTNASRYWFNKTEYSFVFTCTHYERAQLDSVISNDRERTLIDQYFSGEEKAWLCGFTGFTDEIDHENWRLTTFTVPIYEDINEIPVDDNTVDKNGWPSNMMVPLHCGPKDESKNFTTHYERFAQGIPSLSPQAEYDPNDDKIFPAAYMFREYGSGVWLLSYLTTKDTIAMPFYVGNFPGWTGGASASYKHVQFGVSDCPNNYEHINRPDFNEGMKLSEELTLERGQRYFLNARTRPSTPLSHENCQDFGPDETCQEQVKVGENRPGLEYVGPPYMGPCLEEGPYPINYRISHCELLDPNWEREPVGSCERFHIDEDGGYRRHAVITWTCYDGPGGELLAEYEWTCDEGVYRVTEGINDSATMNMACTFSDPTALAPAYEQLGR